MLIFFRGGNVKLEGICVVKSCSPPQLDAITWSFLREEHKKTHLHCVFDITSSFLLVFRFQCLHSAHSVCVCVCTGCTGACRLMFPGVVLRQPKTLKIKNKWPAACFLHLQQKISVCWSRDPGLEHTDQKLFVSWDLWQECLLAYSRQKLCECELTARGFTFSCLQNFLVSNNYFKCFRQKLLMYKRQYLSLSRHTHRHTLTSMGNSLPSMNNYCILCSIYRCTNCKRS